MKDRRKAAINALQGISNGETNEKEKRIYMEAIKILISPEDDLQSDSFPCDICIKNKVVEGENICQAGCLTATDCRKKFRQKKAGGRKNARNSDSRQ